MGLVLVAILIISMVVLTILKRIKMKKDIGDLLQQVESSADKAVLRQLFSKLDNRSPYASDVTSGLAEKIQCVLLRSSGFQCSGEEKTNYRKLYIEIVDLMHAGDDLAIEILIKGMHKAYMQKTEALFSIIYNKDYHGKMLAKHETLLNSIGRSRNEKEYDNSPLFEVVENLVQVKLSLTDTEKLPKEIENYIMLLEKNGKNAGSDALLQIWNYFADQESGIDWESCEESYGLLNDGAVLLKSICLLLKKRIKEGGGSGSKEGRENYEKFKSLLGDCIEKEVVFSMDRV